MAVVFLRLQSKLSPSSRWLESGAGAERIGSDPALIRLTRKGSDSGGLGLIRLTRKGSDSGGL